LIRLPLAFSALKARRIARPAPLPSLFSLFFLEIYSD